MSESAPPHPVPRLRSAIPASAAFGLMAAMVLGPLPAEARQAIGDAPLAGSRSGEGVEVAGQGERRPVLLVPGWGDTAPEVAPLERRLVEDGWPASWVVPLTFRDPFGSNEGNAEEVEEAVRRLLGETGADRVDIVAHSMGGLAVRRFLKSPEAGERVHRVVFMGTPHRGTMTAILARGDGGREMFPGSPFLERLNGLRESGEAVELLSIRTPLDLIVIPGSSAMLPGARNVEVCCPTHHGLVDDVRTYEAVRTFLLGGGQALPERDGTIPFRADSGWWDSIVRDR